MNDSNAPLSVLVVEDDASLRESIAVSLEQAGYAPRVAQDAVSGLSLAQSHNFDIVLCDLRLPDVEGFGFIKECKASNSESAVILMTAFGSSEIALGAIRHGAYDFIAKPFTAEELIFTLKKAEERERLKHENQELRSEISKSYNFSNIIAQSKEMLEIFDNIRRLAPYSTTVLVTGESGTGKELLARALHHNSPRRTGPFVAINCGAIPENLMESELFGHTKGSFTDAHRDKRGLLEEANGGTLFLDEIAEMPLHLQVKLLRALQEHQIRRVGGEEIITIDARVVAATHRNLEEAVRDGKFREDLFYRLNVVSIHVPPLRDRVEDIPLLANHFLKKHSKRLGIAIKQIEPGALRMIVAHPWRGNVRELENCIERAIVMTDSDSIDISSLPDAIVRSAAESKQQGAPHATIDDNNLSIKQHAKNLEVELIRRALLQTKGNRTHAAKILEISHRALLYKMKEYGIN